MTRFSEKFAVYTRKCELAPEATALDEELRAVAEDSVPPPEPENLPGGGVPYLRPVTLEKFPVALSDLAHGEEAGKPRLSVPAGDHEGVVLVRLCKPECDTGVFGHIPIGMRDVKTHGPDLIDKPPPDYGHEGLGAELVGRLHLQDQFTPGHAVVAGAAQRHEVPRGVPARLAGDVVVDLEDGVLRPALAVLARVPVPVEDVLADVPEILLRTRLVAGPGDARVLDLLDVERGYLDHGAGDGEKALHSLYEFDVAVQFVLYGRCQPPVGLPPVEETRLPVPGLATSPRLAVLPPLGVQFHHVGAQFNVRGEEFPDGANRRQADVGKTRVDTEHDLLDGFSRENRETHREGGAIYDNGPVPSQKDPGFPRRTGHQRFPSLVQDINGGYSQVPPGPSRGRKDRIGAVITGR